MSNVATGDPTVSVPETPPEGGSAPQRRSGSNRRSTPDRRVVTMAPSPWRRRKRIRPWIFLSNTTNVLMILAFTGLVVFACWEAETRDSAHNPRVSHARVRPGTSVLPLPEAPEPPKQ